MASTTPEPEATINTRLLTGQVESVRSPVDLQDAVIRGLADFEPPDQFAGKTTRRTLLRSYSGWAIDNDNEQRLSMESWDWPRLQEESGENGTESAKTTRSIDPELDAIVVEIAEDVTDQLGMRETTSQDSVYRRFI